MKTVPLSVQLCTLRSLLDLDFPGTLKQIAKIGYRNVELAGYGNLKSAVEARKALDDAGLTVSGAHLPLEQWDNPSQLLDDADVLGNKNLIVPWLKPEQRTVAGFTDVAKKMNAAAPAVIARGKQIAYHNHDFELHPMAGTTGFDILWKNTDPKQVKAELDVFWIKRAGLDPLGYIRKLADRVILVHLKDQSKEDPTRFAEVGTGTIDFKPIMAAAAELGVQYGVVEQDDCYGKNPLDVIRTSFENLRQMGLA